MSRRKKESKESASGPPPTSDPPGDYQPALVPSQSNELAPDTEGTEETPKTYYWYNRLHLSFWRKEQAEDEIYSDIMRMSHPPGSTLSTFVNWMILGDLMLIAFDIFGGVVYGFFSGTLLYFAGAMPFLYAIWWLGNKEYKRGWPGSKAYHLHLRTLKGYRYNFYLGKTAPPIERPLSESALDDQCKKAKEAILEELIANESQPEGTPELPALISAKVDHAFNEFRGLSPEVLEMRRFLLEHKPSDNEKTRTPTPPANGVDKQTEVLNAASQIINTVSGSISEQYTKIVNTIFDNYINRQAPITAWEINEVNSRFRVFFIVKGHSLDDVAPTDSFGYPIGFGHEVVDLKELNIVDLGKYSDEIYDEKTGTWEFRDFWMWGVKDTAWGVTQYIWSEVAELLVKYFMSLPDVTRVQRENDMLRLDNEARVRENEELRHRQMFTIRPEIMRQVRREGKLPDEPQPAPIEPEKPKVNPLYVLLGSGLGLSLLLNFIQILTHGG